MAIEIIVPDNVPGNMSTGYQYQNNWLFAGFTNLCNVEFDDNYTTMLEGSVYFVNGKLFKGGGVISGPAIATNNYYYIYARGTDGSLYRSAAEPVWNTGKCGYYTGNDRALVKIAKLPNGLIIRVNFDTDYKSSDILTPPVSKFLRDVKSLTGSDSWTGTINRGWYKVTVAGGGGAQGWGSEGGGNGNNGGSGGLVKDYIFLNPYNNVPVKLVSGAGGTVWLDTQAKGGGVSYFEAVHPQYNFVIVASGGGGGGSITEWPNKMNGEAGKGYGVISGGKGGVYAAPGDAGVHGGNGAGGVNNVQTSTGGGAAGMIFPADITKPAGHGWANLYTI